MIRDPSDGSVKEIPKQRVPSGIREASAKTDYQKRLEASREWLKDYKARKASREA